jgi:hypothetical protein
MSTQSLSIFRYADIVAEHASGTGTTYPSGAPEFTPSF